MFAHYRAFKSIGIYDDLIVSFCLGDDHFAVFPKTTIIDEKLIDQIIKDYGLISKVKVVNSLVKADFLNQIPVPCELNGKESITFI